MTTEKTPREIIELLNATVELPAGGEDTFMLRLGHFFCDTDNKTPQRALEWTMAELQS